MSTIPLRPAGSTAVGPRAPTREWANRPLVPQQWAGTSAVRDRERAHYAADDHATSGPIATARGPHPLGWPSPTPHRQGRPRSAFDAGLSETRPIDRRAASARPDDAWPEICDQFGSHMLVLAEQLRATLNVLEADEGDPERLRRLYQVDHAVTRMRLASRQLVTLAGRNEERVAGFTTSLLDVIRMASSAIEWYPQVADRPRGRAGRARLRRRRRRDADVRAARQRHQVLAGHGDRELPPPRRRRRDVPHRGHRPRHRTGSGREAERRPRRSGSRRQ